MDPDHAGRGCGLQIESTIGAYLQAVREAQHLSQRDIAEQMNLDPSTLSRMEAGRNRWSVEAFVQCCQVLNVSPSEVLAGVVKSISTATNNTLWEE
ncbi:MULTISPECIES: helix-turn-helix transcriptional regulator [Brevibacterium]|uniref:helix-turn-helix domain-containing protein n=1 Tax=Brevibacterium TaxID=1696 RepID=UPI000C763093|nr:XRE family transcriptional regulator [Brevibacterium sp.]